MTNTNRKWCSRCQKYKALTEFNKNRARADGLQNYCKPCAYKAHRDSVATHKEEINAARRQSRRAEKIKQLYGISLAEYELVFWEQNGQCPICFRELSDNAVPFQIEPTVAATALLCETCTAGLRFFEQSTDLLFRGISFLDSFKVKESTQVKDESQD